MIFQTVMLVASLIVVVLSCVAARLKVDKDYWKEKYEDAEGKRRKLFLDQLDLLEELCDKRRQRDERRR